MLTVVEGYVYIKYAPSILKQMAQKRKLTLTFQDGAITTVTTARNYMYAVAITKRRVTEDGTLKGYYYDGHNIGRLDLLLKCVNKYRNEDENTKIEVATLTKDPWLDHPERAIEGWEPYERPSDEIAKTIELRNK